ncbi:MAG: MmcQ/YjbR family DNA-binding protein [Pseudomonadales bacterium]|nr:MmcQ/YjbR family DNA-binding protein [Pseudomonadales bacterium]
MTPDQLHNFMVSKPEAYLDYPFGPDAAVYKIKNKMFALLTEHAGGLRLNLKCEPNEAMILRDLFESVTPGYHMNKAHWNSVQIPGDVPAAELERMIDLSYGLVVKKLTKVQRNALELSYGKEVIYR